jgi:ectoine hydroxylase-related dioxygenase (phytanoyl-CoA dioxygenase family)
MSSLDLSEAAKHIAHELTKGKGFVTIEPQTAFPFENVLEARSRIIAKLEVGIDAAEDSDEGDSALIYHLLKDHPVFTSFTTHSLVNSVLTHVLGQYHLSSFTAHCIFPGYTGQPVHMDYPYDLFEPGMTSVGFEQHLISQEVAVPNQTASEGEPNLRLPQFLNCQVLVTLDEFTIANGATGVVPFSQQELSEPLVDPESVPLGDQTHGLHQIEAPPGTIIMHTGRLHHAAMPSTCMYPRTALLQQYVPTCVAPLESRKRLWGNG